MTNDEKIMITRWLLGLSLPLALGAVQGQPTSEWKPFAPKGGGFSVLFPGTPTPHKQNVKTHAGNLDVFLFLWEPKKGEGTLVVGYSEYPESVVKPGSEEKRLDYARDGAVQSAKGKLQKEKKINLGAYPGRELHIDCDAKTAVVTRLYVVCRKLYQTMVVGSKDFATGKEAAFFLDSFKVNK